MEGFRIDLDEVYFELLVRDLKSGATVEVTHYLRPATFGDWLDYEVRSKIKTMRVAEGTQYGAVSEEAEEYLWNKLARRVKGYKGISEINDETRDRIPFLHKTAAIRRGLGAVYPKEPDDLSADQDDEEQSSRPREFSFEPESDSVIISITAMQNGQEHELRHALKLPSFQQVKRFRQRRFSWIDVRGSRRGESIISSNLKVVVDLYDSLVQSVEGYVIGDNAFELGPDNKDKIDAIHKQVVVDSLFDLLGGREKN